MKPIGNSMPIRGVALLFKVLTINLFFSCSENSEKYRVVLPIKKTKQCFWASLPSGKYVIKLIDGEDTKAEPKNFLDYPSRMGVARVIVQGDDNSLLTEGGLEEDVVIALSSAQVIKITYFFNEGFDPESRIFCILAHPIVYD